MKYIRPYESFRLITEQQTQIYKRPKDPYEYKVEDDNWLSRKKGTTKWFNITGGDFKPAYQKSIDLLDKEFAKARTDKAPKRGGEVAPKEVEYTRDNGQTAKGTIVDVDKEKETVTIKAESGKEFEKPFDKVEMSEEELNKISVTPTTAQVKEEEPIVAKEEEPTKETTNKIPAELSGFVLATDEVKNYIKQKSKISEEGTTYVYPSTTKTDLEAGYVYVSGYFNDPKQVKTMWVGTQKEEGEFEGDTEFQDGLNSAKELKEAYDREKQVKKNEPQKQQTQTGQVDQEARRKSKAMDELEDKLR